MSGILSVECARHGTFRPNGTVDLQRGERYAYGDYALAGALQGTEDIERVVLSYDVNCQYARKFLARMTDHFDEDIPHINDIEFLIPKMHLIGHCDDCKYLYSFSYTWGSGRTDGEAPERNWALLNPLSMATREMNSAHRHEVLEDHMREINFKKLMSLRKYFVIYSTGLCAELTNWILGIIQQKP